MGRISLAHPVSIPGYFGANVVHADASVLDKGYFLIAIWIFPLGLWSAVTPKSSIVYL